MKKVFDSWISTVIRWESIDIYPNGHRIHKWHGKEVNVYSSSTKFIINGQPCHDVYRAMSLVKAAMDW